jgi:hypothetical protein
MTGRVFSVACAGRLDGVAEERHNVRRDRLHGVRHPRLHRQGAGFVAKYARLANLVGSRIETVFPMGGRVIFMRIKFSAPSLGATWTIARLERVGKPGLPRFLDWPGMTPRAEREQLLFDLIRPRESLVAWRLPISKAK